MIDKYMLHSASEYKVNGKTYRNLEAQVLYNKEKAERVEIIEKQMQVISDELETINSEIDEVKQDLSNAETKIGNIKEPFFVTVTGQTEDPTRPLSADKTWAQIWEAITSNKEVVCVFNLAFFRYMGLGSDDTFPLIFSNNGAYIDTDRADTIRVNTNNVWIRETIATSPMSSEAIQTGDRLIVGHQEDNGDKIARGSLSFNKAETNKYLCQDGTFKIVPAGGTDPFFKITVTQSMATMQYSADKTYNEIQAAISAGQMPYIYWDGAGQVLQLSENLLTMGITFSCCRTSSISMTANNISISSVRIFPDNTVSVSTASWMQEA